MYHHNHIFFPHIFIYYILLYYHIYLLQFLSYCSPHLVYFFSILYCPSICLLYSIFYPNLIFTTFFLLLVLLLYLFHISFIINVLLLNLLYNNFCSYLIFIVFFLVSMLLLDLSQTSLLVSNLCIVIQLTLRYSLILFDFYIVSSNFHVTF